ncbi:Kynurenine/alpha-aminoadipate aminotransferase, mitochondrial [Habropoda laboriosa]|uniref:Kynurenine/alpha-aminoadipate aminotransferase, mitochondrial n=1 Tax=Habropoda laboriosa TaxID=597456 RepID=A0A0L7RHD2_9HYME|nr:Kynurenine/alpha-aminoadipate aminotransferase, mitochondrial [Habropoda laboriosa]
MDCAKFLTSVTKRRKPSIIREWAKRFIETPNGISLANGMPNTKTFPFEEITVTYKNGIKGKLTGDELSYALQYGPSQGCIPLVKKMRELQIHLHKPAYNDWDILFTSGSMDGCNKIFEMILELGDPVMVQVPTYNGILNALAPFAPEFLEIPQDHNGIIPEIIIKICKERIRDGKPLPKIIYVNPTGANPTGTVLSESRRKKLYEVAVTYDFLILEDDPYRVLQFLDKKPTTFLELDTEGRVLRLDSFSKILSAGIRLGVVTAHKEFIKKLTMHMETTNIHASSMSQMLLFKLLNTWGQDQLEQHFNEIQRFYRERRDIMLSSIEKHLSGLAEWNVPQGGMFVWLKINEIKDVMELASKKCISQGIFIIPGHAFNYDKSKLEHHLRLSYSYATPTEIDKVLTFFDPILTSFIY